MKLDRAFKPTPRAFHDSILMGIQKGEKKVKLLHKIRIATAVAALAACALLVAFAAGNTGAPAPTTQTPLTQGSEDNATTAYYTEVYYTEHGNFYHYDERCSGMENAMMARLEDVVEEGKQPCPICVMHEMDEDILPDITPKTTAMVLPTPTPEPVRAGAETEEAHLVYYTEHGKWYHWDEHCQGMANAKQGDVGDALAAGKKACPVCVGIVLEGPDIAAVLENTLPGCEEYLRDLFHTQQYDLALQSETVTKDYHSYAILLGNVNIGEYLDNGSEKQLLLYLDDGYLEWMVNACTRSGHMSENIYDSMAKMKGVLNSVLYALDESVPGCMPKNEESFGLTQLLIIWDDDEISRVEYVFDTVDGSEGYEALFDVDPADDWKLTSFTIMQNHA